MTTLFALPDQDALQLSEVELEMLTGSPMHKLQIEWLRERGWTFTFTRGGRPVVGRLYANLKLSGVEVATMVQPQEWTPDMTAIN